MPTRGATSCEIHCSEQAGRRHGPRLGTGVIGMRRRCKAGWLPPVAITALAVSYAVNAAAETPGLGSGLEDWIGTSIDARDSIRRAEDPKPEAEACLKRLCWHPTTFAVRVDRPGRPDAGDLWLSFPAAGLKPSELRPEDRPLARVVVEWYAVRDGMGRLARRPAVVVVHESGSGMTVGRMIARGLRQRGVHAFMVQLPGYGARKVPRDVTQVERFGRMLVQSVRDVRRTRDAVTALPVVVKNRVALQGTSLGGFVAATVAGIDDAFSHVFVLLAGGDLYTVVMTGARDAAGVRRELLKAGLTERQIRELAGLVEPLHVAHRVVADRFWLFRGKFDTVVPPECSRKLARAIGLEAGHEIVLPVNHYSGIVFLPATLDFIAARVNGTDRGTRPQDVGRNAGGRTVPSDAASAPMRGTEGGM
ncbi:MAG: alpha/beta fold hydrolase [Planctomycetota bacterium]|nr:MAG: alpha/beta fold hydrolase [Planctomycetota bacterium]